MHQKPILRAIALLGSQVNLARAIGVHPMQVTHWKNRGIPKHWCQAISDATDGQVTVHELRPDVYGAPEPCHHRHEASA